MKYPITIIFFLLMATVNAQWELVEGTENLDVRNIIIMQNTMYLGTGGLGLWRGDASGSWEKFNYEVGLDAVYVRDVMTYGSYIFAGTSEGLFKSSDNGASWVDADANADFRDIYTLELVGGKVFAGGNHGLFVSLDGGATFTRNENEFANNSVYDILATEEYVYVVGSLPYISSDGGETWSLHYDNEGNLHTASRSLLTTLGFIYQGTHGHGVYMTLSELNWSPRNEGIENVIADDLDALDSTIVVAGWTNGVYVSEDLGLIWTDVTGNLPNAYLQCIAIYGGYLYVGIIASGHDGLYRMPLPGVPVANETEMNFANEYKLYQNYPNPFNPVTRISFNIPENTFVKLEIFDMLGNKVIRLVNENLSAGEHERSWNAENNSSGVYFYKLETGGFTQVKKLMLLK